MKRLALTCTLLAILAWAAAPALAAGPENPFAPKLPFQTAVITYRLAGSEQGTATLYIDGQRQARERDTSLNMMGMVQKHKSLTIIGPDKIIEVDLNGQTAKSHGNMQTYLAQEFERLSAAEKAVVRKNAEKFGGLMAQQFMGGKPQTTAGTFLGQPVDIITVGHFTSYIWKDLSIPLKTKGNMMGMLVDEEATSVQTNVAVKSGVFEVPAGIQVRADAQADQMMRQMASSTLAMLKDPQFESKAQQGGNPMLAPLLEGLANDPEMSPEEREDFQKMMQQRMQQRQQQRQQPR